MRLQTESYLVHTVQGISIREIARRQECHASTILRQIRRIEDKRSDPYFDQYMQKLEIGETMDIHNKELTIALRELCHPNTLLVAAEGMEIAVVVRSGSAAPNSIANIGAEYIGYLSEQEFIKFHDGDRIRKYKITELGREFVQDLTQPQDSAEPSPRRVRYNSNSPLDMLSRRRGKDGKPFISMRQHKAGQMLYIDFREACLPKGTPATLDWDSIGMRVDKSQSNTIPYAWFSNGTANTFEKVMRHLGEGLADVALHAICYERGLEDVEKALDWSARSGKIVLRIALERVAEFYESNEDYGMIG